MKFYVQELLSWTIYNPAKEIEAKSLTGAKRICERRFKGDIQLGTKVDDDMMIYDPVGERINGEWAMY